MATNVISGRTAKLQFSTTSTGTSGTNFGGMRSFELTVTRPTIDVVHQDTSGWTERLPGNAAATLTAETVYLTSGGFLGQDDLRDFLSSESRRYFFVRDSTSGTDYKGWGYVTSWSIGGDQESPAISNFEIMFDGAVTEV